LTWSDDSSRLFDVKYFVSFFSVSSIHRLPVKYWFDVWSLLFCSDEIIWLLLLICSFCIVWDEEEAEGGGGALAFRRAPGDLKK
jgi:hypothetical protein